MAITIGVLLAGIGALLYVKRKSIEVLYNKDYWAILCVVSKIKHDLSTVVS